MRENSNNEIIPYDHAVGDSGKENLITRKKKEKKEQSLSQSLKIITQFVIILYLEFSGENEFN